MFLSNRLCNPTGDDVEIPYHKGVVIQIPSDGFVDLTADQMDDFRKDKPGSEETQNLLGYHGLFLEDNNLDYDTQALAALQRSHKAKNSQYKESVDRLRKNRAAQGITEDKEAFNENLAALGLLGLKERVDRLERRIKYYKKVVSEKAETKGRSNQFDPEKTLFMVEGPPKEFASKAAKAIFKQEHPELVHSDPAESPSE